MNTTMCSYDEAIHAANRCEQNEEEATTDIQISTDKPTKKASKSPSRKRGSFKASKKPPRKRDLFCCICNNTIECFIRGKHVKLYSFPSKSKLKETWIRRLKSVKPDYEWSTNHRLCSAHFIRGVYDVANAVPSIFVVKDMERVYKHPIPSQTQINEKEATPPEPPTPLVELGESLHDWHAAATLFGKPMSKFVCHLLYVHTKYCLHCGALARVMSGQSSGGEKTVDGLDVDHDYIFSSSETENPAPDENAIVRSIDQSTGETSPVKQQRNDRSLIHDYYGEAAFKQLIPEVNNTEAQRKLIDSGEVEVYIMKRLDSRLAPIEKNLKLDATANSRNIRSKNPSMMSNQEYYEQPISYSRSNASKKPLAALTQVHSDHPRSLLKGLTIGHKVVDTTVAHTVGKTSVYPADDMNVSLDDDDTTDDDDVVDDITVEEDDMDEIPFQQAPASKFNYVEPQSNLAHLPESFGQTSQTQFTIHNTDDVGKLIHLADAVSAETPQSGVFISNALTQANTTVPQIVHTMDEAAMAITGLLQSPEFTVIADLGPAVTTTVDSTSLYNQQRHSKIAESMSNTPIDGDVNPPASASKQPPLSKKKQCYRFKKKPVSCPQCHKVLASLQSLTRHMMLHYTDPRFTCHICGKGCQSKRDIKLHMDRHNNSNIYQCTICSKQLHSPFTFKDHMKAHGGVKDIPCKICNSLFVIQPHLRAHMLKAHGIGYKPQKKMSKSFVCEFCGKAFINRGAMLTHHNVHDEIPKEMNCHRCGKMFANNHSLGHHVSNIHKETPKRIRRGARIVCHLCGRTLWSDNLRRHNKRRHKDIENSRLVH